MENCQKQSKTGHFYNQRTLQLTDDYLCYYSKNLNQLALNKKMNFPKALVFLSNINKIQVEMYDDNNVKKSQSNYRSKQQSISDIDPQNLLDEKLEFMIYFYEQHEINVKKIFKIQNIHKKQILSHQQFQSLIRGLYTQKQNIEQDSIQLLKIMKWHFKTNNKSQFANYLPFFIRKKLQIKYEILYPHSFQLKQFNDFLDLKAISLFRVNKKGNILKKCTIFLLKQKYLLIFPNENQHMNSQFLNQLSVEECNESQFPLPLLILDIQSNQIQIENAIQNSNWKFFQFRILYQISNSHKFKHKKEQKKFISFCEIQEIFNKKSTQQGSAIIDFITGDLLRDSNFGKIDSQLQNQFYFVKCFIYNLINLQYRSSLLSSSSGKTADFQLISSQVKENNIYKDFLEWRNDRIEHNEYYLFCKEQQINQSNLNDKQFQNMNSSNLIYVNQNVVQKMMDQQQAQQLQIQYQQQNQQQQNILTNKTQDIEDVSKNINECIIQRPYLRLSHQFQMNQCSNEQEDQSKLDQSLCSYDFLNQLQNNQVINQLGEQSSSIQKNYQKQIEIQKQLKFYQAKNDFDLEIQNYIDQLINKQIKQLQKGKEYQRLDINSLIEEEIKFYDFLSLFQRQAFDSFLQLIKFVFLNNSLKQLQNSRFIKLQQDQYLDVQQNFIIIIIIPQLQGQCIKNDLKKQLYNEQYVSNILQNFLQNLRKQHQNNKEIFLRVTQIQIFSYLGVQAVVYPNLPIIRNRPLAMGFQQNGIYQLHNSIIFYIKQIGEHFKIYPHQYKMNKHTQEQLIYTSIKNQVYYGAKANNLNFKQCSTFYISNNSEILLNDLQFKQKNQKVRYELQTSLYEKVNPDILDGNLDLVYQNQQNQLDKLITYLNDFKSNIFDGQQVVILMHRFGINVRYLGQVLSKSCSPIIQKICFCEMIARALTKFIQMKINKFIFMSERSKDDINFCLQYENTFHLIEGQYISIIIESLNKLFGDKNFWIDFIQPQLRQDFQFELNSQEINYYQQLIDQQMMLLKSVAHQCKIEVKIDGDINNQKPFNKNFIKSIFIENKRMNYDFLKINELQQSGPYESYIAQNNTLLLQLEVQKKLFQYTHEKQTNNKKPILKKKLNRNQLIFIKEQEKIQKIYYLLAKNMYTHQKYESAIDFLYLVLNIDSLQFQNESDFFHQLLQSFLNQCGKIVFASLKILMLCYFKQQLINKSHKVMLTIIKLLDIFYEHHSFKSKIQCLFVEQVLKCSIQINNDKQFLQKTDSKSNAVSIIISIKIMNSVIQCLEEQQFWNLKNASYQNIYEQSLYELAQLYQQVKQSEKSKEIYLKFMNLQKKSNKYLFSTFINLGAIFLEQNDLKSSQLYVVKALEFFEQNHEEFGNELIEALKLLLFICQSFSMTQKQRKLTCYSNKFFSMLLNFSNRKLLSKEIIYYIPQPQLECLIDLIKIFIEFFLKKLNECEIQFLIDKIQKFEQKECLQSLKEKSQRKHLQRIFNQIINLQSGLDYFSVIFELISIRVSENNQNQQLKNSNLDENIITTKQIMQTIDENIIQWLHICGSQYFKKNFTSIIQ